jgi:thiamine pyrophosphate-dependent acetolactate synthase large subunit-like protein
LNPRTTDKGYIFDDDAKVVHVDTDPRAIEKYQRVDLAIQGDAKSTVQQIDAELADLDIDRADEFWTDRARRRITDYDPLDDIESRGISKGENPTPGTIDPRVLIEELNTLLPDDRVVVLDGGHQKTWVLDAIETEHPDNFLCDCWSDWGVVGLSIPFGIGAATATDKPCVVFCGDAGLMMTLQELETACRNDVPLVVVLQNDNALGAEYQILDRAGDFKDTVDIPTPELAEVATALGGEGYTIRDRSDIRGIEDVISDPPEQVTVLNCMVDRELANVIQGH